MASWHDCSRVWEEVSTGMVRRVPPSGKGQVPEMGRCPGLEKCRGRGRGAGAEDGQVWSGRVSVHAAEGHLGRAVCGGEACRCRRLQWMVMAIAVVHGVNGAHLAGLFPGLLDGAGCNSPLTFVKRIAKANARMKGFITENIYSSSDRSASSFAVMIL
jgi:hypothetical protein